MSPSDFHPGLTPERLNLLAAIIAGPRNAAAKRHAPRAGETMWSLGTTSHERTTHALRAAAPRTDWLRIIRGDRHFRFAVGGVPMGFYRGAPHCPKGSALKAYALERSQAQKCFFFARGLQNLYRVAVETDRRGYATNVSLVRMDEFGQVFDVWPLDFSVDLSLLDAVPAVVTVPAAASSVVTPMAVPAKKLPRARVTRKTQSGEGNDATGSGSE